VVGKNVGESALVGGPHLKGNSGDTTQRSSMAQNFFRHFFWVAHQQRAVLASHGIEMGARETGGQERFDIFLLSQGGQDAVTVFRQSKGYRATDFMPVTRIQLAEFVDFKKGELLWLPL
jgi:hypothetical protein